MRQGHPNNEAIYATPSDQAIGVHLNDDDFINGTLALVAFAASAVYGDHEGAHHFITPSSTSRALGYDLGNPPHKLSTENYSGAVEPVSKVSKGRFWGTKTYSDKTHNGDTFRGRYYTADHLPFVIAAIRGTVHNDPKMFLTGGTSRAQMSDRAYTDWDCNNDMWNGNRPWHLTNALQMVKDIEKKFPKPIILTGHSLGGGIAQLVGYVTGYPMLTLNAPRVLFKSWGTYGIKNLVNTEDLISFQHEGHSNNGGNVIDRFGSGLFLRTIGDAVSREGGQELGRAIGSTIGGLTTQRYYPITGGNSRMLELGPSQGHHDVAATAHATSYLLGYFMNDPLSEVPAVEYFFNSQSTGVQTTTRSRFEIH
jgi:hypothetical protein